MKMHLPRALRRALLLFPAIASISSTWADSTPWLWDGGSAPWLDDSTSGWLNVTGSGPAGQDVTFSASNAGVVTIDEVTPAGINVTGGQYTFEAASDSSAGIVTSGVLTVSGADTVLEMNLDNPSFSGSCVLEAGQLYIGASGALGGSSLYFNGGQLCYAAGIEQDVSVQVHSNSNALVRVNTGSNSISWTDVDGVRQTLSQGIEKTGSGELTLVWNSSRDSHGGLIVVDEGQLVINKQSGQGTLTGAYSGSGTLVLTSPSGQFTVRGDSSGFSGTLVLSGDGARNTGSVSFANGNAMGGASTQVVLSGQRFWFNGSTTIPCQFEVTDGITTYVDGRSVETYTYTGSFTGSGTLSVIPACSIIMQGDISGFTGNFVHPGDGNVTWRLGGDGIEGTGSVRASLGSTGSSMVYTFWYSSDTTMSGVVSGQANLRQRGSGALILTGQNTTTGYLEVDTGCEVRLGTANESASWSGTTLQGNGLLTLVNGSLANALSSVAGSLVADVAPEATVTLGGMNASAMQSISIAAGGLLTGISGDLIIGGSDGVPALNLTLAESNLGTSSIPASGERVMLQLDSGKLLVNDSASVTLDMETIKSIIQGNRQALYLHITNADIELASGFTPDDLFSNSSTSPAALGLVVLGIEGGNIVLEGAVTDVYMVTENGDYDTVTSYSRLQDYKATFIDSGYTLSLNLPGDSSQVAWMNNVLGSGNLSISNTDEASGVVRVLLNNEILGDVDSSLTPDENEQINSANTLLEGNISAGKAVQLVKTGSGMLTVGGVLSAQWLEIDEGTLKLTSEGNQVESLHGDANIQINGSLEITGNSLDFSGSLSGEGRLILNGSLPGAGTVGSLSGNGQLLASESSFFVQNTANATFSGQLSDGNGMGVLIVKSGAGEFTLNRVQSSDAWTLQNQGKLLIQLSGSQNAPLTLNDLQLEQDSNTVIIMNTDTSMQVFSLGGISVNDYASVELRSTGQLPLLESRIVLGDATTADLGADEKVPLTLGSGTPFQGLAAAWLQVENGKLVLYTLRGNDNLYANAAQTANGNAGARMLWSLPNTTLSQSPDLRTLTNVLDSYIDAGNRASADRLMAAAAGAGVAALACAVAGDVERQLKAMRNRTTSMGLNPAYQYDDLPLFNAWINAEGDYRRLDGADTASGYTLSSWGGTVGCDADFSTHLTAGLAITAMYGSFDSEGSAQANGDVDNYYLSLFGRYIRNRWVHTMVGSIGLADISMKRNVQYGSGSYRTSGSTDGVSVGLMYELGYVIPLDAESRSCIEPVFNITYRHIGIEGYREHGSDAALHVGRQNMDIVTFGLGARGQTYALENLYNRSCLLEARLLFKIDAGDRRSHGIMTLLADSSRSARIKSAEQGLFGMEMGMGISIPIGAGGGNLFMDAGLEFRSDDYELNGTIGYRLTF